LHSGSGLRGFSFDGRRQHNCLAGTVLSLAVGGKGVWQKLVGGGLGVLVSFGFLTVISGAGNDLAVFLVGLAVILGTFDWLAGIRPDRGIIFRQAGALFAVAATILPRPSASLFDSAERQMAVLLGLLVALFIHWIWTCSLPAGEEGEQPSKAAN
jgi:hypothetical protein